MLVARRLVVRVSCAKPGHQTPPVRIHRKQHAFSNFAVCVEFRMRRKSTRTAPTQEKSARTTYAHAHARTLSHLMLRYTAASESGRGRGGPWPLAWPALAQKRVSGAAPPAATAPLAGRREKLASGSPVLSQFTDCVSKSPKT